MDLMVQIQSKNQCQCYKIGGQLKGTMPSTGVERISQAKLRSTTGKCFLERLVRKEF
jgi:hypothetical protein